MAKQITEKDANQLLKQFQSLNSIANGFKPNPKIKTAASSIEKTGDQLCKENKDMPDK